MEPTRPLPETAKSPSERAAPVFIAHDGAGTRLWVAADLDTALRALGLDTRPRFDRLIESLAPDRTRAAGRATTREIDVGPLRVHLKRALKGGVLAPLFAGRVPFWRRVGNELHVAAALYGRGAPVPRPVFAAGRLGPLGWRAVLGSECVDGALDGATALEQALGQGAQVRGSQAEPDAGAGVRAGADPEAHSAAGAETRAGSGAETRAGAGAEAEPTAFDVPTLLGAFGRTIRAFHEAGGWHADLAITNLLFVPETGRVWIVDLQGGRAGAFAPRRRRQHELARLRRSIERRPAIRAALEPGWTSLLEAYEEADAPEDTAAGAPDEATGRAAQRAVR